MRTMLLCALGAALHAASVETTLLGRLPIGLPPLTASDRNGNLIVAVTNPPCGFLQDLCSPITVAKLEPSGKIAWRRGIGESSWRIQVTTLSVDPAGNIVLGAITPDSNLPTMRPVQPRAGGEVDVYLWQLAPDASRTTFATYLGGSANDELVSLRTGPAGEIAAVIMTTSRDFPFSAQAGPALPPQGLVRWSALVRIVPSSGVMSYALGSPVTALPTEPSFTSSGAVRWVIPDFTPAPGTVGPPPLSILQVQPDGTRARVPTGLPSSVAVSRMTASPDGGLWMTGFSAGVFLPTTPNAIRPEPRTFTYARIEDRQRLTPSGPPRNTVVRFLAVDGADRNRIFAATTTGFLRSDDNGWTWNVVNDTPLLRNASAMAVGAGRIWLVGIAPPRPALLYSDDAGATWRDAALPATAGLFTLAAHPTDPATAFVGSGPIFYVTRDAGETWSQRQLGGPILGIAVDPSAPDTIAVTTVNLGGGAPGPAPATRTLLLSEDGGRSFPKTAPLTGVGPAPGLSAQFDPNEPGRLYYSEGTALRRTSKDTFPQADTLPFSSGLVALFAFQPGSPGTILGMSVDGGLFRSGDGGRSWTPLIPGSFTGPVPQQMAIGSGGVVHVVQPIAAESFIGKLGARGDIEYLSYFGTGPFTREGSDVFIDSAGRVVLTGLTGDPEFPGERLRGDPSGLPPILPPVGAPDIFVMTLMPDGTLVSSVVLVGTLNEGLYGAAPGPAGSLLLLGYTPSPDFPGLGSQKISISDGAWVFLARLVR